MRQVLQSLRTGEIELGETPARVVRLSHSVAKVGRMKIQLLGFETTQSEHWVGTKSVYDCIQTNDASRTCE